jgi:hypothetical protein
MLLTLAHQAALAQQPVVTEQQPLVTQQPIADTQPAASPDHASHTSDSEQGDSLHISPYFQILTIVRPPDNNFNASPLRRKFAALLLGLGPHPFISFIASTPTSQQDDEMEDHERTPGIRSITYQSTLSMVLTCPNS